MINPVESIYTIMPDMMNDKMWPVGWVDIFHFRAKAKVRHVASYDAIINLHDHVYSSYMMSNVELNQD